MHDPLDADPGGPQPAAVEGRSAGAIATGRTPCRRRWSTAARSSPGASRPRTATSAWPAVAAASRSSTSTQRLSTTTPRVLAEQPERLGLPGRARGHDEDERPGRPSLSPGGRRSAPGVSSAADGGEERGRVVGSGPPAPAGGGRSTAPNPASSCRRVDDGRRGAAPGPVLASPRSAGSQQVDVDDRARAHRRRHLLGVDGDRQLDGVRGRGVGAERGARQQLAGADARAPGGGRRAARRRR